MNVNSHTEIKYNLELTQDEYVAIIAAIFMSTKESLIKRYKDDLSEMAIDNIDETLMDLARQFINLHKKETSIDIIKSIRLEGIKL